MRRWCWRVRWGAEGAEHTSEYRWAAAMSRWDVIEGISTKLILFS